MSESRFSLGQHIINSTLRIYIPLFAAAIFALVILHQDGAVLALGGFILLEALICECAYFFGPDSLFARLKLDVAPFAAITMSYFFSFFAGIVGFMAVMLVQDLDRDTSKFAEIENAIFNLIIAALAALFAFIPFFLIAALLTVSRLIALTLTHVTVFNDFNPRYFLPEAVSAVSFLVICRVMIVVF